MSPADQDATLHSSHFRYLQQWVFFGVCVDQEEEFGIRENPRALAARGVPIETLGVMAVYVLTPCVLF